MEGVDSSVSSVKVSHDPKGCDGGELPGVDLFVLHISERKFSFNDRRSPSPVKTYKGDPCIVKSFVDQAETRTCRHCPWTSRIS